jgi:hypothetical protein
MVECPARKLAGFFMRFTIRDVILAFALLAAGCGSKPPIVIYEVRGGGSANVGQESTASSNVGNNHLELQKGKLTVNGKQYGLLKNGDRVVVEEDGTVKVNDSPIQPISN